MSEVNALSEQEYNNITYMNLSGIVEYLKELTQTLYGCKLLVFHLQMKSACTLKAAMILRAVNVIYGPQNVIYGPQNTFLSRSSNWI